MSLTSFPKKATVPTTFATNVVLTNISDGKPVEILYKAQSTFVWPISYEVIKDPQPPTSQIAFDTAQSTDNLSNNFYPTIAVIPIPDNLYSEKDSGGFFTQTKLGASQYINTDFSAKTPLIFTQETMLIQYATKRVGGRGFTKKDQETIYTWEENNQWIKEPATASKLSGAVKKNLTKNLQTFVPYQNSIEQNQFGLITPNSRVTPWGGLAGDEWTDTRNEPKSFTGVRNISAWVESQALKQNQKMMDCWVSDIYGNQYGLFKSLKETDSIYYRTQVAGQLWVRSNEQAVKPSFYSLSSVFNSFKAIDENIYNQLIGEGITNIDCFFDTLMIQTSSIVMYSKIRYNYETATIESLLDDTRFKILLKTDKENTQAGQSWFFQTKGSAFNLFTTVSSNQLLPELYELNLNKNSLVKQFPYSSKQQLEIVNSLSSLHVDSVDIGLLTYNKQTRQFLISIPGKLTNGEQFLVDIILNDQQELEIDSVTIYVDTTHPQIPFATNTFIFEQYYYDDTYPILIDASSMVMMPVRDTIRLSVSAINNPTYFQVLNYKSNVTATSDGTFSCYFEDAGIYHVNYKIGNSAGFNIGCLSLSAVERDDVLLLDGDSKFLSLNGYTGRFVY